MRISFNNNLGMLPFLFSSRILFVNLNVPTYDKNKCTQVHIVALQMALYPSGESQNKQRIKFLDDDDEIYIYRIIFFIYIYIDRFNRLD